LKVDPAALQVLISRLTGVATEMGEVLRRSAFSPNIKERADCSAAVFTPSGELLVQAEHIPVHLGSMPASVQAAIASGIEARPDVQIILNDPFRGGTHLNDVTLVAPVFLGCELIGWVANRAHHADLGGMAPGSIPPAASEIYQEGLRIPPLVWTDDITQLICANSRTAEERRGDLEAQGGCNRVGAVRLTEMCKTMDWRAAIDQVVDYGERRMRAAIGALPDGEWLAADTVDSTGADSGPATIRLRLSIRSTDVHFDFAGTDPQQPGNVNAVAAVTASAVAWALRSATDPTIPANGGAMRPVTISAPSGSLVAAVPPVAVGAGNVEVSQRVADVCLLALSQVVPDRIPAAGQGTMNNLMLGGRSRWVYYETIGGGQGGRPGAGGMSGVHTGMTNTRDTPAEALERAYPLKVLRYRLRYGSGGVGNYPGGDGIDRVIQVLEPAVLSLITERRVSRPWGLAGGSAGACGENWLWPGGDEARRVPLPDKVTIPLKAGDAVQILTPGGGGWGAAKACRA
jgi:N-methylhydantoinase B/oxoprolinase/acetone carboxylase alpha subunit